ncbi:MAG: hypothetical protein WCT49_04320 [Candidatus Paceibacterota bacterium]|nr:hypothetical protein [Candidatus Paceibacterota bacterium]
MSIGTLTFCQNNIPEIGETVYIVVEGKSFPTGCWKGVLTYVGDVGKSRIVSKIVEYHAACTAEITDPQYPNCEPDGHYSVFPSSPGTDMIINKLNEQKAEVKELKKRLEENEQTARDVFKGLFKLAGVHILDVTRQSSGLGAIYAPSVKK